MSVDLRYGDVEESLRASLHDLLADRCPAAAVAACYGGDRGLTATLWRALSVELGLAALLVPQECGGAGASAREAAVVLEELGRSVAPVPFLTSAVVATTALAVTATGPAGELLAELASGEVTAALAVPFASGEPGPDVSAAADGALTGEIRGVAGALDADVLLVPTPGGDLRAVAATDVQITAVSSLDMTRPLADLVLTAARGTVVATGELTTHALSRAAESGAALLASEQLGVARWCLDETVGYLRQRRQFGRVLGGFQALKHRLADLYVTVESARAAARYAAATQADEDPDRAVATSLAQVYCSDAAVHAAEEALQLHGGIGMTWDHPIHLYLKRAKADQIAYGTPGRHLDLLAGLVDLPAPG